MIAYLWAIKRARSFCGRNFFPSTCLDLGLLYYWKSKALWSTADEPDG
jgi:hypothetical protein